MFKNTLAITRRELYSSFASPIAYILIASFLVIYGAFFFTVVFGENTSNLSQIYANLTIIVFMLCPLMSMRLFSEEKKNGTLELLLTSPIRTIEIVLGKYLSVTFIFFMILVMTFVGPLYLSFIVDIYWPPLFIQALGLFLVSMTILGIGMVYSSLTENQIISGTLSAATSMVLFLLSWVSSSFSGVIRIILEELTILAHYSSFNRGVFDLKDFIYYFLWIIMLIFLTYRFIERIRWQ